MLSMKQENLMEFQIGSTVCFYVKPIHLIPTNFLKLFSCFSSYPLPVNNGSRVGLFARGCLINHSCQPNCYPMVDGIHVTWKASEPLEAGQDLKFNYIFSAE